MRWRICSALTLLLTCASAPAAPSSPRPHTFVPAPSPDPNIRLESAPMEPARQGSRIGRAELDQARALLSQARRDLEPRQWAALDRKLSAAEQAFERFSAAAKKSGKAAEVARRVEGPVQAGRPRMLAGTLSRVGPLLVGFVLLWPSSTASAEFDRRPEWLDAQSEFEARLQDLSKASREFLEEVEVLPRAAAPAQKTAPQNQTATALAEEDNPKCKPIPLPRHLGGHDWHNECADKLPGNSFPGGDVYVNGKNFDALQLTTRTLWEVKTNDFEKQPPRSQDFFVKMKLPELKHEKELAEQCGYKFVVGVHSHAHRQALLRADRTLTVVIMDWC